MQGLQSLDAVNLDKAPVGFHRNTFHANVTLDSSFCGAGRMVLEPPPIGAE